MTHRGCTPATWSSVAALYDLQLPLERAALSVAASLVEWRADEWLLDVGTGTGALLHTLTTAEHGGQRHAVGVDSSVAMLRRMPALPSGWAPVAADARALPFADGAFGLATASYLLHTLELADRRAVLVELRRVLKPAGRLVIVSVAEPSTRVGRGLLTWALRTTHARSGVAAGPRPWDPHQELKRHGFAVRGHRRVGWGYPSICVVAERT